MKFLGTTYVYNTPNNGPRELGVTGKLGGDPRDEKVFVAGWMNDDRTVLHHLQARALEPCSDYRVLQQALDKYAEKGGLVEWQDSEAAGGVASRAVRQSGGQAKEKNANVQHSTLNAQRSTKGGEAKATGGNGGNGEASAAVPAGKLHYEVVSLEWLPLDRLCPHPDADQFPRGEDDQRSVNTSVTDSGGVIQPLLVLADPAADGKHLVIDGCTRLEAARAAGIERLNCLLVHCDNVPSLVRHVNMAGRRRSTGSRIMAYLLEHETEVLAAYDKNRDLALAGASGGRGNKSRCHGDPGFSRYDNNRDLALAGASGGRGNKSRCHGDPGFSSKAIAAQLQASDKDVKAAVQLLHCNSRGVMPGAGGQSAGKNRGPEREATAEETKILNEIMCGVLGGVKPVRKWEAGLAGKRVPAGESGKAATNWQDLSIRTAKTLRNVFQAWPVIEWDDIQDRTNAETDLLAALKVMPEFMRGALPVVILNTWSPLQIAALYKTLAKDQKEQAKAKKAAKGARK